MPDLTVMILRRLVLMAAIEYSWNVYPAAPVSSATLLISHLVLLSGLWAGE